MRTLLSSIVLVALLSPARADQPAGPSAGLHMLSLKQAYSLALKSHPSVQMLKERVRQAEAARYRAWSQLKPTASFQGTFTHFDKEIVIDFAGSGSQIQTLPDNLKQYQDLVVWLMTTLAGAQQQTEPIVFQKQNQFGWSAVANLPVFRGPAYPGIGMARKQVRLAKLTEVRSRRDFLLRVAQAYYVVVSQKEVVTALEHKVKVDEKHLAAARARFQVGQSPRSEVLRADLVATQDRQKLRTQTNTLHAARRQLALLVGLEGSVDVRRPAEPRSTDGRVGEALAVRHDYLATDVAIRLAKQGKDTVWWGFLPMLDLSWLYRWSETEGFSGERGAWQLMFTLNVPIYDGGVRYANLREASAKHREALAQRRALALQIESEIVKLRADVESANAGVISARKALELAKTTASDMEVSFEAGAVTQLDVLDANQRLLDAELALTAQIFQRDLARMALAHALGKFNPQG